MQPKLAVRAADGLHDHLIDEVLPHYYRDGDRAVDLGCGSGAFALRLRSAGWDVTAADIESTAYKADVRFAKVDFNEPDFAADLGIGAFGLVTSVEVIEHVESPIGFLRNIGRLLKPGGVAVLTTPNVDNAPARVKFLLTGTIRMMDIHSEKTHITPIFWDLFTRQFMPIAGVELVEHDVFPHRGYQMTRAGLAQAMQVLALVLRGQKLQGDNHVIVLKAAGHSRSVAGSEIRRSQSAVPA